MRGINRLTTMDEGQTFSQEEITDEGKE